MAEYKNREGYPDPTAWRAMKNMEIEQYKRQIAGARAKAAGEYFEQQISGSLNWHEDRGLMKAEKTPEPMKPLKPLGSGKFIACYTKQAQADFCGTIRGGRAIRFEAKQTDSDRFERKRLTDEQMNDLREHQKLGALCFVLLCFGADHFYRVPWEAWENMKQIFGRLYVKEDDLKKFRIPYTAGVIKILAGILDPNEQEPVTVPDICVACGEYAGEGSHVCPNCRREAER